MLSIGLIAVFAYMQANFTVLMVALASLGGLLGFLRFNTYPARIFMGDTGSQFLGYIAACLALLVTQAETATISPLVPILVLGLPILDTIMVMALRVYAGRSPFSPDNNHLHHRFVKLGFRHYEAVAVIYLLQMLLLSGTWWLASAADSFLLVCYSGFCVLILGGIFIGRSKGWRLHPELADGQEVDRRNPFYRRISAYYPLTGRFFNLAVAGFWIACALFSDLLTRGRRSCIIDILGCGPQALPDVDGAPVGSLCQYFPYLRGNTFGEYRAG
jgi:UDP-GlcNAc:undecaprenyl-phosphate GlcNAc-1-phosphate transferase